MYKRINVVLTFKQLAMQEILEAIKEKAKKCEKEGRMFHLPWEAESYVVEHEDNGADGDFWKLEKGEQWLKITSKSRDGSRTFQNNPDRSTVIVEGKILQDVTFSDSWDEGRF